MTSLPYVIVIVTLSCLVALFFWQRARARQRTEALERLASEMGFAFEPEADLDQLRALGDLPLYGHGRARHARNALTGRVDHDEIKVFDYQYTTGGGRDQQTWRQTVVLFPGSAHALPDFVLAPENVLHRIGQLFGYQDIDFDSSPAFSRLYLLRGPDETAIRSAFDVSALAFFAERPGWSVEARSGSVCVYRAHRLCAADQLRALVDDARAVLRALRRE